MKLNAKDLRDILEIIDEAEAFRPVIRKAIEALFSFSEEAKGIFEPVNEYFIERRIKTINRYQNAGFTKQEAILMTLDSQVALLKQLKDMKKK